MTVKFIIPCFNANQNMPALVDSLLEQTDDDWHAVFIDDMSEDHILIPVTESVEDKFTIVVNEEKKFALRNIIENSKKYCEPDDIVAVIDGDDRLCNSNTVKLLHQAYADGCDVVWTAHKWDINGQNISRELPAGINPYQYPWCSSHLRTFKASLLDKIPEENFKDHLGNWFERGYDQALMLPAIKVANKCRYIPEVCYLYNINSVSVNDRDWAERKQLSTINFVRARGFVNEQK